MVLDFSAPSALHPATLAGTPGSNRGACSRGDKGPSIGDWCKPQPARQERRGVKQLTTSLGFNSASWGFVFEKHFSKATNLRETRRGAAERPGHHHPPKRQFSQAPARLAGRRPRGGPRPSLARGEPRAGSRGAVKVLPPLLSTCRGGTTAICMLQRQHNPFVQQIPRRGRWRGRAAPSQQTLLGLRRRSCH